jgi:hypothetical protein
MKNKSPDRRLGLFLFLILASIIIISPQIQMVSAGACGGANGDCDQDSFTPAEGDCDDYNANIYPGHGSCEVPIKEINEVIIEVQQLPNLSGSQANALLVKLETAIKKIESDKINAAIGSLNAFINQIKALMNSKIILPEVGNQLISDVENIIIILKTG